MCRPVTFSSIQTAPKVFGRGDFNVVHVLGGVERRQDIRIERMNPRDRRGWSIVMPYLHRTHSHVLAAGLTLEDCYPIAERAALDAQYSTATGGA